LDSGRFSPSTSVSPANSNSADCSTITITCHPGLVHQAKQWPQYQVDSVSPHEKQNSNRVANLSVNRPYYVQRYWEDFDKSSQTVSKLCLRLNLHEM
jgi:hypothetical protein